jgi:hypothetical protein
VYVRSINHQSPGGRSVEVEMIESLPASGTVADPCGPARIQSSSPLRPTSRQKAPRSRSPGARPRGYVLGHGFSWPPLSSLGESRGHAVAHGLGGPPPPFDGQPEEK